MSHFPADPVSPARFFEEVLPAALSRARVPEAARALSLALGVRLDGPEGGEWLVSLGEGRAEVRAASREEAPFTLVQSVEDWRGALWEGRGSAAGRAVAALFRPDSDEARAAAERGGARIPAVLRGLSGLRGLVCAAVTGQGAAWRVALQLGPGPIPDEPTTTLSVAADDAERMLAGDLGPMEAFLAGRIQVKGDMGLLLQAQAAQMEAAADARDDDAA